MFKLWKDIKPAFWDDNKHRQEQALFNYRKIWLLSVLILLVVSLVPLSLFMTFNYQLAHQSMKKENRLRTVRITSNARRTLRYFFQERLDALRFIAQDIPLEKLRDKSELQKLLIHMKLGFGGLVDLGVITEEGIQINYVGPFEVEGKNYHDQNWFSNALDSGAFISDVFLGYRQLPHMIAAVKFVSNDGKQFLLRATLDIKRFVRILSSLDLSEKSDAFICNRDGVLQTPSRYYGRLLENVALPIPDYSERTRVLETVDPQGNSLLIGYAYIQNSPYILMLVKQTQDIMQGWYDLSQEMILLFISSVIMIVLVVFSLSTFMVNRVYEADKARLAGIEHLESHSRLIAVGRLAAGVAHEINNPLAVISENAGLIKDLIVFKQEYKKDPKLIELVDEVLGSVERCGQITRQLLGFARHFEARIEPIDLSNVITQVLSFVRKEALYRNIQIQVDIPEDFPTIYSDRGKLQQILLNLVNNAFQAMNEGGMFNISAQKKDAQSIAIRITDDGCGIPPEHLPRIFDPFFTQGKEGGTGLGLSITHGLIRKMHGEIAVQSELGKGTTFIITLPIESKGDQNDESATCG